MYYENVFKNMHDFKEPGNLIERLRVLTPECNILSMQT